MGTAVGPRYKWVALSNTTLGVLIATINMSIMLIALPDIFRGIGVDPLQPGNTGLLLWLIMGYLVVTAVLVVSFGRLGDMYGRARMYNTGFAVFTVFSILLSVTWAHGTAGALWLIAMRVLQGVGGAMLMANSSAILTDAFPPGERGLALGLNQVAGITGSFLGLVIGGLLGPIDWRLVFLVSVPFGLFGTVWAFLRLKDTGIRTPARPDWWGNITFGAGLIAVLAGITYGIQPYGGHPMGWTNPAVLAAITGGIALLGLFCLVETRVPEPMFRLDLFRIRAFTAGNLASLLASLGRGGLMFILIIWLQGIWLPRHGYGFAETPLWAGIYMLPLTLGFLVAGPVSGWFSDRYGARIFTTGGMLLAAGTFAALQALPVDFDYPAFALILLLNGIGMGLFAAPNRAAIMNSLPPDQRGVGAGISTTFQNSAMVLSIGVFFSLMIAGLAGSLPTTLTSGLTTQGVPAADAVRIAALPPVGVLFASLLGYNPVGTLLGSQVLDRLPPGHAAYLTGREFFPQLISGPFAQGLSVAFDFAMVACLVAAVASLLRGGRYIHGTDGDGATPPGATAEAPGRASAGGGDGHGGGGEDGDRRPAGRTGLSGCTRRTSHLDHTGREDHTDRTRRADRADHVDHTDHTDQAVGTGTAERPPPGGPAPVPRTDTRSPR
ncbi:MFS transporter (plasmid) [Streptomyces clavuligerus]|nr:MFS transporter [Streptomyces clavuligerus]ANW22413.1 MFS transporter [Streptomyces clavuligerus]AXU17025.1 MFS transporter [Streptomyces clavuligerus]AXU17318.1 MFS transporter [Streptomyces clavuligerus]EDY47560.1 multidrug transporter [Streptomyces clavuligerus]MBY6307032.1 MFS transporter [Streptomyces clavuligerus]